MLVWNPSKLTKKGRALLAKAQDGRCTIEITKAQTGSGVYAEGEETEALTALKEPKQTLPIATKTIVNDTTLTLRIIIANKTDDYELTEGYDITEFGVFATDPDEGEILYSVATAANADHMPSYNGIVPSVIRMTYYLEVSNAQNVTINVIGTGAEEALQAVDALKKDVKILETKVKSLTTVDPENPDEPTALQKAVSEAVKAEVVGDAKEYTTLEKVETWIKNHKDTGGGTGGGGQGGGQGGGTGGKTDPDSGGTTSEQVKTEVANQIKETIGTIPETSTSKTVIKYVDEKSESVKTYVGEIPKDSTAKTAIAYTDERFAKAADDNATTALIERYGLFASTTTTTRNEDGSTTIVTEDDLATVTAKVTTDSETGEKTIIETIVPKAGEGTFTKTTTITADGTKTVTVTKIKPPVADAVNGWLHEKTEASNTATDAETDAMLDETMGEN